MMQIKLSTIHRRQFSLKGKKRSSLELL